jgi:dTDP-glucose 4,6-dehydratase
MGYATTYNIMPYHMVRPAQWLKVQTNINQIEAWRPYVEGDYKWDVVDFASESHVDNSISKSHAIFSENSTLTASICETLGIGNIGRFIHASTDEIYGELSYSVKEQESKWFSTSDNIHPNNPYSASKVAQDAYLMSMEHTFGMQVTFIRMANQFGPHQHPEKMLPASILRALKGETIKIYGEGLNVRQWTPVVDTVSYIYDLLADDHSNERIIHFAAPQKLMTNSEVVEIWRKILKDDHGIETQTEFIEDRKGHDTMYALKDGCTDGQYTTDIVTRFRETIQFYVENKDLFIKGPNDSWNPIK